MRDAIGAKEYEQACERLIGQFKTLWDTVRSSVGGRKHKRGCHLVRRDAWKPYMHGRQNGAECAFDVAAASSM